MLVVEGLTKHYPSFSLQDVSFEVPPGFITGLIGVNGSGKTTILKSIVDIVRPDAGTVTFDGRDLHAHEAEAKQRIGIMLGAVDAHARRPVRTVVDVYRRFYAHWDGRAFRTLLDRFGIEDRKPICELSTGMRVKLGVAMALSHGARLLLLDEPTSGLDPVAREELLALLQEVVEDGDRAVLFSTHITGDLDRCADHVVFVRDGRVVAADTKDDMIAGHVLVRGRAGELTDDLQRRLIGHRSHSFGFSGLARSADLAALDRRGSLQIERPDLEALMLYYELERAR